MDEPTRLRSAAGLAIWGSLSLTAAVLAHEIISFGPWGHDAIAGWGTRCIDWTCVTPDLIIVTHIAKALSAALIFGLFGMVVRSDPARIIGAAILWLIQYGWSMAAIASGYKAIFGTTWRLWEPFVELAFDPALTTTLALVGLASLYLTRGRPARSTRRQASG